MADLAGVDQLAQRFDRVLDGRGWGQRAAGSKGRCGRCVGCLPGPGRHRALSRAARQDVMTCATDSIRTGTAAADSPAYIDIAPMGRGVRVPQDRAELRGGELERSVSDEQQVAPLRRADE